MNNLKKQINIFNTLILTSTIYSQEFKIQFSSIPIGQGLSISDSNKVLNSIGGSLSQESSSELFKFGDGFLKSSQHSFSKPPEIKAFTFPNFITKNSGIVEVEAIVADLNGVNNTNLHLQLGGQDSELIIPMFEDEVNIFKAIIPDSIIDITNFRARVYVEDNLGYVSNSSFKTGSILFSNNEMTMSHENSFYPSGIQSGRWRLISWPGIPSDLSLAESNLSDGHVFYRYDPLSKEYIIAKNIELGMGYWFKHSYKDDVIFDEDTSTSIPLEKYLINLKPGWNIIGSPFSFSVGLEKDSIVGDLITFGRGDKDGWSTAQNILEPWNGYAVYTSTPSSITLNPFNEESQSSTRAVILNEWSINIKLESDSYFNYMMMIGRKELAKNLVDIYDVPSPKFHENKISILASLDGESPYQYISDFRSTEDFNGVWDLRLNAEMDQKNIRIFISNNSLIPKDLYFSLIDIQNKYINYEIINTASSVENLNEISLDYKIVSGDLDYVVTKSEEILKNIPHKYSLSQNYPNPFNPITNLEYKLPKRSKVQILIYNVLGQEVKTLINEEKSYGTHLIFWDGLDQKGNQVSTGVYFARMVTNSFTQTKKMLLLK